jgi:hypothetical protein
MCINYGLASIYCVTVFARIFPWVCSPGGEAYIYDDKKIYLQGDLGPFTLSDITMYFESRCLFDNGIC